MSEQSGERLLPQRTADVGLAQDAANMLHDPEDTESNYMGSLSQEKQTEKLDRVEKRIADISGESYKKGIEEGSSIDTSTGLLTRGGFETVVQKVVPLLVYRGESNLEHRPERMGDAVVACAMFDVNHLKIFNDKYGHVFGDEFISEICKVLNESKRKTDPAACIGGDEFLMLLPTDGSVSDPAAVMEALTSTDSENPGVMTRIFRHLERYQTQLHIELVNQGADLDTVQREGIGTVAAGLVVFDRASVADALNAYSEHTETCRKTGETPSTMTNFVFKKIVDKLLYEAKQECHETGKNCCRTQLVTVRNGMYNQIVDARFEAEQISG